MSKYQLEDLLNEITGTGRIGTYIDTYRGLVNKIDDLKEKGIRVKELGMSGDGKTAFEFEVYPGDKDEAFSVYPYKFDPRDEDDMEIFRFSIGGKPVAIRAAKELLGDGAYSNAEIKDGLDQLDDAGDDTSDFDDLREKDDMKKELPKSIADKEKAEIEKDAKKAKGMMKEEEGFTEVSEKEVRFHLDAYRAGTIDGDDLAQAIEEIVFGDIVAPGMNEDESVNEELAPTGIAISQKQLDNLKKLGAISGLEVYVQDKDGSNVRKVDYTLTNTDFEKGDDDYDYLEEGLKEHFGRFMKDYQ